ncbi:MAG: hypothetical protein ABS939_13775 [Psychrobacillus sp.]
MTEKRKIELKPEKNESTSKIMKHLSIDKTKIPLTDEEYEFLRDKFDEHIAKHGITFGFVYNLFLKDREDE